jgi:hypothetical protein
MPCVKGYSSSRGIRALCPGPRKGHGIVFKRWGVRGVYVGVLKLLNFNATLSSIGPVHVASDHLRHGSREVLYMMWRVTICMMVPEIEIDS